MGSPWDEVLDPSVKESPSSAVGSKATARARVERVEELEDRVKERTKELLQSQSLLRQLASELTIAEQRERRRIATDLHDYLAQLLVCARLKVSQSRVRMEDVEVEGWLGESDDILQQALTYTRSLVAQLTPMALHEFGLTAALKWLADQMRQQYQLSVQVDVQPGISVTLRRQGPAGSPPTPCGPRRRRCPNGIVRSARRRSGR